jgi:hypothetical protein
MLDLNKNWRLVLLFPDEFTDFIAEIYYQDNFVCLISQENGYEKLDIEIHSNLIGDAWKFNLADFELAVEKAKQRLWDLCKDK